MSTRDEELVTSTHGALRDLDDDARALKYLANACAVVGLARMADDVGVIAQNVERASTTIRRNLGEEAQRNARFATQATDNMIRAAVAATKL